MTFTSIVEQGLVNNRLHDQNEVVDEHLIYTLDSINQFHTHRPRRDLHLVLDSSFKSPNAQDSNPTHGIQLSSIVQSTISREIDPSTPKYLLKHVSGPAPGACKESTFNAFLFQME